MSQEHIKLWGLFNYFSPKIKVPIFSKIGGRHWTGVAFSKNSPPSNDFSSFISLKIDDLLPHHVSKLGFVLYWKVFVLLDMNSYHHDVCQCHSLYCFVSCHRKHTPYILWVSLVVLLLRSKDNKNYYSYSLVSNRDLRGFCLSRSKVKTYRQKRKKDFFFF